MGSPTPQLSSPLFGFGSHSQQLHLPRLQDVTPPPPEILPPGVSFSQHFPHPSPCWLLSRPLGGQAYLAHGGTHTPQPIRPEGWAGRGLTLHGDLVTTQLAAPETVLVFTYRPGGIQSALFCSQAILTWTINDMILGWTCPLLPGASQVLSIPSARAVGLLPRPLTPTEGKAKTWRYG